MPSSTGDDDDGDDNDDEDDNGDNDRDGDERISFQEFLDTIVLFSRGKIDDKLRIIFDMCDNDRNGSVDKAELSELFNSLVDTAKTNKLSDSEVTHHFNFPSTISGFYYAISFLYRSPS